MQVAAAIRPSWQSIVPRLAESAPCRQWRHRQTFLSCSNSRFSELSFSCSNRISTLKISLLTRAKKYFHLLIRVSFSKVRNANYASYRNRCSTGLNLWNLRPFIKIPRRYLNWLRDYTVKKVCLTSRIWTKVQLLRHSVTIKIRDVRRGPHSKTSAPPIESLWTGR